MHITVLYADRGGCALYRMISPARAIHNLFLDDVTLTLCDPDSSPLNYMFSSKTGATTGAHLSEKAGLKPDVLVLQRVMHRRIAEAIPFLQEQGIRVIMDLDDDMGRIEVDNVAYVGAHPTILPRQERRASERAGRPVPEPQASAKWLRLAAASVDLLTVSTPALAERYGQHGRVAVIPNTVPKMVLDIEKPWSPVVTLGWAGSPVSHPHDLEATRGAVGRVCAENGTPFHLVGGIVGESSQTDWLRRSLHLPETVPVSQTGWLPLEDYMPALSELSVGIVPLADTAFNAAKSHLKGLEMAALGIPFVASPTREYLALERAGIGVTARRPRDWQRELTRLVADKAYRQETGARYRTLVAESHTVEQMAPRWAEAWLGTRVTQSSVTHGRDDVANTPST